MIVRVYRFINNNHRPTYCNVCRDLSMYFSVTMTKTCNSFLFRANTFSTNQQFFFFFICCTVTSHGLSCEVCKCKVHKRCAVKAIANCKWTTLATVGREIIEDVDGVSEIDFFSFCAIIYSFLCIESVNTAAHTSHGTKQSFTNR